MARKQDTRLEQIRDLREAAMTDLEKGRTAKAAERYLALEALDPEDPAWAKRGADCYQKLGMREQQIAALARAADGYAKTGFLLKAIALSKLVLSVDGSHQAAKERLIAYQSQMQTVSPAVPRTAAAPATGETPSLGTSTLGTSTLGTSTLATPSLVTPSLVPGAALESVAVRDLVPPAARPSILPGVFELDLGEAELIPIELAPPREEEDSLERVRTVATRVLPRVPLLSDVDPVTLEALLDRLRLCELGAREILFSAGDPADAMYIIAEGVMEVQGDDGAPIALLGEGEFLGELGIIAEIPRTRTVVALEPSQLLALDRSTVTDLINAAPALLPALLRFVRDRLVSRLTDSSPLFAPFSSDERQELVRRFRFLEAERDSVLLEQGQAGQGLFILLSGQAAVSCDGALLAQLESGDVFGEMSLLARKPAMGTVRVTRKAFVLFMPAQSFVEAAMAHPQILLYTSELYQRRVTENVGGAAALSTGEPRLRWV